MKIIGIDPGLDGGIAIMIDGDISELIVMPVTKEESKKKLKSGKNKVIRNIDCYELANIIFKHKDAYIFMEKVNPFAGMGSVASTRMALSIGRIEGALIGMGFKWTYVTPGTWQRYMWINEDKVERKKINEKIRQSKVDTKKTSWNAAQRIFPSVNFILLGRRAPHDGLFDSALIAEYGKRKIENEI